MTLEHVLLFISGKVYSLRPGANNSFDPFFAELSEEPISPAHGQPGGSRYRLTLHPKEQFRLQGVRLEFRFDYQSHHRLHCNGFQSWSHSRDYPPQGKRKVLRAPFHRWLGPMGEPGWSAYGKSRRTLRSWHLTFIREGLRTGTFLGSLDGSTAFTCFSHLPEEGLCLVEKAVEGLEVRHSFPVLDLLLLSGDLRRAFDRFHSMRKEQASASQPLIGWTSWYRYSNRIDLTVMEKELSGFAQLARDSPYPAVFQIDDGWQSRVGDWVPRQGAFPKELGAFAVRVKEAGLQPGIWVAPFVCSSNSSLRKQKPSWLLHDRNGRAVRAGWNPLWGGWFYALDIYHPDLRAYLTSLFHTLKDRWGFSFFKLDFLYAAALCPPPNKTGAQVLNDALEFLRFLLPEARLLGCGVPMEGAFPHLDYCRVGADTHTRWEHEILRMTGSPERVSTFNALSSVLSRWYYNGRGFGSDPDVVILRNKGHGLNCREQETLLRVNALLGRVWMTSDEVAKYPPQAAEWWRMGIRLLDAQVTDLLPLGDDLYRVDFSLPGEEGALYANLGDKPLRVHKEGKVFRLEPHASRLFLP